MRILKTNYTVLVLVAVGICLQRMCAQELNQQMAVDTLYETTKVNTEPEKAYVHVTSQVPNLRFESNRKIDKVNRISTADWEIWLPAGTHILKIDADGYQRLELVPYSYAKKRSYEIRIKAIRKTTYVLDTEPSSASIRIDGAEAGIAPLTTTLDYGEHLIEIQKRNYESLVYKVMLNKPRVTEKKILAKEKGTLVFDTDPTSMHVTIDDQEEFITPFTLTLNVGEHVLAIKEKDYEEIAKTIDISKSGLFQKIPLRRCQAPYSLKTEPAGASVRIDGDETGKTPLTKNLDYGKHRIEINLAGYDILAYDIFLTEKGLNEIKDIAPYYNNEVGGGLGFSYSFDKKMFKDVNGNLPKKGGGIFWSLVYRYHFTSHFSVGLRLTGCSYSYTQIKYIQDGIMNTDDLSYAPEILGAEGRWTFYRGKAEPYVFLSFGGVDGDLKASSNSNTVISTVSGFTLGVGGGVTVAMSKNIAMSVELCSSFGSGEWSKNVNPYFNDLDYNPSFIAINVAFSYRWGGGAE